MKNTSSACIRTWVASIIWYKRAPTLQQSVFLTKPEIALTEGTDGFVVPSLTPVGFAYWMTLMILAYPDEEWRRLQKVVEAMPIDADGDKVDGKPERLPKQIVSRACLQLPSKPSRERQSLTVPSFSSHDTSSL